MSGYHVGGPDPVPEDCPCKKAPCGLVLLEEALADCQHHYLVRNTLQQVHPTYACPGKP